MQKRNKWKLVLRSGEYEKAQVYWYPTEDAARDVFYGFYAQMRPYMLSIYAPDGSRVLSTQNHPDLTGEKVAGQRER